MVLSHIFMTREEVDEIFEESKDAEVKNYIIYQKRWVVYFRIQEVSFSAWIQQVKLRLDAKIWDL